ncbi:Zinc finger C2HC domain-containing protein 1A [Phytophthora pseudosyringae]|uniref:Zinc finger C2HC domain-containing protein 1A n=1 Tax=Phytophthora pseudosyringae TaxID=221518 RepID=A0A8T1WD01_9STRA|nr:Zinc finger C2HC domain-containing protein 1A [Phytophthora pseudosyringae]
MQQPGTRLRCDPTDYAKRQQEKKERAKELREQRQRGVYSDDHTFAPKVNARTRNHPSPPGSREELDQASRSSSTDSMSNRNYGHNNNHQDMEDSTSNGNDALDNLSRRYPKKAPSTPQQQMASLHVTPLEPEHDTLFREVKRATGREIEDLPIRKTTAPSRAGGHTGPCLRNSSCGCPKCGGGGLAPTSSANAPEPPIRRREPGAMPSTDPYRENNSGAVATQNEMGNSLMLLKSKMSRRKARSAPTNQASLFVEKNIPSAVVHSARLPSSTAMSRDTPSPPPRQPVAPRRVASQAAAPAPPARRKAPLHHVDEDSTGDTQYPVPITTGFNLSADLDEYADGAEQMEQCHNCSRKFNIASFQKHQKICEKVFSGQRKVFNMAAKRLEGTEAEKIAREAKSKNSSNGARKTPMAATEKPIKAKGGADWKQKSDMFRNAMKASRDVSKALKEGKELPPMIPSAPDPSLIQCEYCSRRFNEKAAERHINFCREKSQRDNIKGPAKRAPASKPGSRAAAVRKR